MSGGCHGTVLPAGDLPGEPSQCHLVKSFKTLAVPFTGACLPSSYTEVYALEYIRAFLAGTSIFSIIHAYIPEFPEP